MAEIITNITHLNEVAVEQKGKKATNGRRAI